MLTLRSYQVESIEKVKEKFKAGVNKQVLVLATGLGKTVIFVSLINDLIQQTGKKALIVAHREELLTQAKEKIEWVNPKLKVDIEMADQRAESSSQVIVASVASIGRSGSKRLEKFNPKDFCVVVIDEAHHASAQSYKTVLAHFGLLKQEKPTNGNIVPTTDWNKDCLLLGVTATPNRMDNEGIDKIFDETTYNYGIIDGIKDSWLSRIHAYRVDTRTSLAEVHTLAGDFNQGELADAINNPERNQLVVDTYLEQFKGKQALVFTVDIAHADALKKTFIQSGVRCQLVDGTTPKDIRKQILEDFHKKDIQVVVNCMVLTEGYDNDTIDVIMMARPTKSGILYQQMIGRGTRTHHEKPYLTVVDFVDNTARHTIKTSASLLGIDAEINFQGEDIVEAQTQIDRIRELSPDYDLNRLDFKKLDYIMEEVDLIGGLGVPKDIQDVTRFAWQRFGPDAYRISIGESRYFVVQETLTGQWETIFQYWDRDERKIVTEKLGEEEGLMAKDNILKRTDQYITSNYPEVLRLVNNEAHWRSESVSEAQEKELRRLGVDAEVIAHLNKGTASQLQNKLYGQKAQRHNWNVTRMKASWR